MDLEARLSQHLKQTGDGVTGPPADASKPLAIVGRRQRRRWFLGSTAAVLAVAMAGFGAYRLTDDTDRSVDVIAVDEDVTDDDADDDPAPDDATTDGDGFGGGSDVPGGTSDVEAASSLPESTGPVLEWEEVGTAPGSLINQIVWHDDAFVATVDDQNAVGLLRSVDGRSWEPYGELPDEFAVFGVRSAGSALVAWGTPGDGGNDPLVGPTHVLVSTADGGWTDLGPLPEPEQTPPANTTLALEVSLDGAAVLGDLVVVSILSFPNFDVPTLLADQGIDIDPTDPEVFWGYEEDGVFVCNDLECNDRVEYSYEEIGLTEADQDLLNGENLVSAIYYSVGGGEFVFSEDLRSELGLGAGLVAADDAIITAVPVDGATEILRTVDGMTWESVSLQPAAGFAALTTDGNALFATDWDAGAAVRSTDGGVTWEQLPIGTESLQILDGLQVGPGGLAATFTGQGPGVDVFTLEKDGYTIIWNGDESLTVIDADGNTVLAFDEEELATDEPPETVLTGEDGGDFSLTFLDPETLEPLVTVSDEELEAAYAPNGDVGLSSTVIGWTADGGGTWGWQTAADAFGEDSWAMLTVGESSVLAIVFPSDGSASEIPTPQLFVAPLN